MITKSPGTPHICYLDFDGILHDDAVFWHPKRGIYLGIPGRALFEWTPALEDLLLPHPEVKIVLSTSWVHVKSFRFAKEKLTPALQARVIGATFHSVFMQKRSSNACPGGIKYWPTPRVGSSQAGSRLIMTTVAPRGCRDRLVRTDDRLGLSDPAVQDAIRAMLKAAQSR